VEQSVGQIGPAAETSSPAPTVPACALGGCPFDANRMRVGADTVGTTASMVLVGGAVGIGGIAVMLGLDALVIWVL
jgi:hypothetical protein